MTATTTPVTLDIATEEKERRRLKHMIKQGKLPRFMFIKGEGDKLERKMKKYGRYIKPRLTWRLVSTLAYLMKADK